MIRTLSVLLMLTTVASDVTLTFAATAAGATHLASVTAPTLPAITGALAAATNFLAPVVIPIAAAPAAAPVVAAVAAAPVVAAAAAPAVAAAGATALVVPVGTGVVAKFGAAVVATAKGAITLVSYKLIVGGVVVGGTIYVFGPRIIDDRNAYLCTGNGAPTLLTPIPLINYIVDMSFCSYAFSSMHIMHGTVQKEYKINGNSLDGVDTQMTFTMTLSSENIKAHALRLYKNYQTTNDIFYDMIYPMIRGAARIVFQNHNFHELKGDLTSKFQSTLSQELAPTSYQIIHLSVIGGYPGRKSLRDTA